MKLPFFTISFILCTSFVVAQNSQQTAMLLFLETMPEKFYNKTITKSDMVKCRNLYDNTSEEPIKRRCLLWTAQYERQFKQKPFRSLELLLPYFLDAATLKTWQKENSDAFKIATDQWKQDVSEAKKAQTAIPAEPFPCQIEPPELLFQSINDGNVLLALEVAQSLAFFEKVDFALRMVDHVGQNYTDATRAFAAECGGNIFSSCKIFSKATECYKIGLDVLNAVGNKNYFYEKSGISYQKEELTILRKRLSESLKNVETQTDAVNALKKYKNIRFDLSEWKSATPKVDQLDIKASFIICMISDGNDGVFVGTEDYGVYHYDSNANVKQYTDKDGLGDANAYALCIDKLGRLWVGHQYSGVSVFNGNTWKNYDVVDGPIGERIFDIQTCPVDGDVWMATSAGITRYKIDGDEWEHFTREDGLLEDQASSLAFKNDGTLIVGTQCHGLSVFNRNRDGNYKHSKNITAPERFGPNNCSPVPLIPFGEGLPTNQINQILVANNGTIWIATPTGLVKSNDKLTQLQYIRGKNYADKVRGLYGGAPKDWKECPKEIKEQLLPEDYVTCLVEDENGTIWIGTRQQGFMAIDPQTGRRGTGDRVSMGMADNYVSSILPMGDSMPLIGLYIGGVIKPKQELKLKGTGKTKSKTKKARPIYSVAQQDFPKLPSVIKPPTIEELQVMLEKLEKFNKPLPKVYAAYYGEDWKTKGNWVGQYGRQYAVMCAANSPFDHKFQYNEDFYTVRSFIGPFHNDRDTIRRWVHWIKTDNPRTLYDPLAGYRRQSEWDDHGEAYPFTKDGPDLWYLLDIKNPGIYKVDMYFFNKDGHSGHNRLRDYMIEIYPSPTKQRWTNGLDWQIFSELAEYQVLKSPPLAKSRMHDFWGGVHKQFILKGEEYYAVKIRRNYSFNTILSLVAVDRIIGEETLHDSLGLSPWMEKVRCEPPKIPEDYTAQNSRLACDLWLKIDTIADRPEYPGLQRKVKILALQTAKRPTYPSINEKRLFKSLAWRMNLWYPEQRETWEANMVEAWRQFEIRDPAYVQAGRDFLNKRIKPYPSTEAKSGVRLKVPDFKPVPERLKRKPN